MEIIYIYIYTPFVAEKNNLVLKVPEKSFMLFS